MTTLAEIDVVINAKIDPLIQGSKQAEKLIRDLDKRLNNLSKKKIAPQVNVRANTQQLDALIAKMNQLANRKVNPTVDVNTRPAQRSIDSLRNSVSGLASTVAAGFGVKEIQEFADAWTSAGNKIRSAAEGAGVQARSLEDLKDIADESRSSITATVDLYAKLITASSNVAKSEQEIADATSIVTKAFKASGASTQEQVASIIQLGQALGSGVLQGDELRSIREQAPLIARAIAKEFDTTVGGLKKLGEEGKLTSDRVFKAILAAGPQIERQFAKTNATIGDSFTRLKNSLTEYIGQMNETYGISKTVGNIMGALAGNIDSVANAAAAAAVVLLFPGAVAVAGALLNPFVLLAAAIGAAAYALTEFWDELVPLEGSMASLGDYAGAVWDMVSEGAQSAMKSLSQLGDILNSSIQTGLAGVGVSFEDLLGYLRTFVNQAIQNFVNLKDAVEISLGALPNAIAGGVVGAMNLMTTIVEGRINQIIQGINQAIGAMNGLSGLVGGGNLTSEIGLVDFGRFDNKFADSAAHAAKEFGEVFTRDTQDYVGQAADGAAKALAAITDRANERARQRAANQRDADSGAGANRSEFGTGSTAGYGGFDPSSVAKDGKKKKKTEYEREVQQIKDRTAALVAETEAQKGVNPLIDDYGYASTRAKSAQELLTAAQKTGIAAGKELKDVNQLLKGDFDGLTPAAREQAQAMLELATKYGEAEAAAEKLAEQQKRTKANFEDFKSSAKDVLGGFITDMKNGKSASEALANALGKVADKLLDIGLNILFDINGAGGGGGGIFGGLLKGLFKSFDGGGSTGSGPRSGGLDGKGGYLAMVHPQETVIDHTRASVNVPNYASQISNANSRGTSNVHVTAEAYVSEDGNWEMRVKDIATKTSANTTRQGIAEYDKSMPNRIQQINQNPSRR